MGETRSEIIHASKLPLLFEFHIILVQMIASEASCILWFVRCSRVCCLWYLVDNRLTHLNHEHLCITHCVSHIVKCESNCSSVCPQPEHSLFFQKRIFPLSFNQLSCMLTPVLKATGAGSWKTWPGRKI